MKNNEIIILKNLEASFLLSKLVLTFLFIRGGYTCSSMPPSEQWRSVIEMQLIVWEGWSSCGLEDLQSPLWPSELCGSKVHGQPLLYTQGPCCDGWSLTKREEGGCLFCLGWRNHPIPSALIWYFITFKKKCQSRNPGKWPPLKSWGWLFFFDSYLLFC